MGTLRSPPDLPRGDLVLHWGMDEAPYRAAEWDCWLLRRGSAYAGVVIKPTACGYWRDATWWYWKLPQPLDAAVRTYVLERLVEEAYDEVTAMMVLVGGRRV